MNQKPPALFHDKDPDKECRSGNTYVRDAFAGSLLFHTIMNDSSDTIYFKDLQSRFVYNSRAHALGFNLCDPAEMIGKSDYDYFPKSFADKTFREEQEIIRTGIPLINAVEKLTMHNGELKWFSASKYPLCDETGNTIGTWGTSRDITNLKRAEAALARANRKLREQSRIDDLSGIYNRKYFYELLKQMEKRILRIAHPTPKDTFSLIAIDIDHFKEINDTFGHLDGDNAIRHISSLLQKLCRKGENVFRVGGDEYILLLPNTNLAMAKDAAERIRLSIAKSEFVLQGKACHPTASIGVACYDEEKELSRLLHTADMRLYHSKLDGRNKVT